MKKIFVIVVLLVAAFVVPRDIHADDVCALTDPCAGQSGDAAVSCYQNVIDTCGKVRDTLSSQINYLNNQIQLTTFQIQSIKKLIDSLTTEIDQLAKEVDNLEQMLLKQTELLQKRVPESYKRQTNVNTLETILFSNNLFDLIQKVQYIKKVQQEDWRLFAVYKKTQDNYNERKIKRETTKTKQQAAQKDYEQKNAQLAQQKQTKDLLLAQTNGQEVIYQQLLTQAKAQLAGFSSFASNQGGATILSNQTVCDDWGCYYNQRDSQWGTVALNHTQYTLASDGCLVTSMAMIYTHLGHKNVTPLTINSNPLNFAAYYPAFLNRTIVADGMTTTRIAAAIDSELNANRPVVVGMRYGNGDTHFIVLISGSSGNYTMNDPFIPNGHKIAFKDYYSLGSVYEIDRIN